MGKYKPFERVNLPNRKWPGRNIEKMPILCSVDLRDGNQALPVPMSIDKKLKMFQLLVELGFKEIEVGFPSASQIEFDFARTLIDENLVPDDVYLQILTQAREPLIIRSLESLQGAKNVIIHLYNSTSTLQRKITFNMSKEEIKQIAIQGTRLVKQYVPQYLSGTNVKLQYSPESFSDTEMDYALEICSAVMDVWEPTVKNPIILNLPETVEWAGPHVYADQIEYFIDNLKEKDKAIISLHTHNDRGTGIAAAELGVLAGAHRVEGTLFGNGERTGNMDIVNFCLNLYSNGLEMGIDLTDVPRIRHIYEETTGLTIPPRHPYAGDLVFTAFSGSHQDAIKKGLDIRNKKPDENIPWEVPYLTIDPKDIGRSYEAIVRINSQSGKGGVAYIMQYKFGINIPKKMQPEFGKIINDESDRTGRELTPEEIYEIFKKTYLANEAPMKLIQYSSTITESRITTCSADIVFKNKPMSIKGEGNGPIDAFMDALKKNNINSMEIIDFYEQALNRGSSAEALSFIQMNINNKVFWGVGIDTNITIAGIKALIDGFNRSNK